MPRCTVYTDSAILTSFKGKFTVEPVAMRSFSKPINSPDDCKIPFFAALRDEFLCGVSGNDSPAQNDDGKGFHGLAGLSEKNCFALAELLLIA